MSTTPVKTTSPHEFCNYNPALGKTKPLWLLAILNLLFAIFYFPCFGNKVFGYALDFINLLCFVSIVKGAPHETKAKIYAA
jgi:uncharacterized membrane-anchored protein YitT (DUF2179 family)